MRKKKNPRQVLVEFLDEWNFVLREGAECFQIFLEFPPCIMKLILGEKLTKPEEGERIYNTADNRSQYPSGQCKSLSRDQKLWGCWKIIIFILILLLPRLLECSIGFRLSVNDWVQMTLSQTRQWPKTKSNYLKQNFSRCLYHSTLHIAPLISQDCKCIITKAGGRSMI